MVQLRSHANGIKYTRVAEDVLSTVSDSLCYQHTKERVSYTYYCFKKIYHKISSQSFTILNTTHYFRRVKNHIITPGKN
jgi:hypothetical protein